MQLGSSKPAETNLSWNRPLICQELSWRLEASLQRRQGDRYSLGDLWPGVAKLVRPLGLGDTVDAINQRLEIRNLLGGHFNEFADSIAWSDVELLAEDVLALIGPDFMGAADKWSRSRSPSDQTCMLIFCPLGGSSHEMAMLMEQHRRPSILRALAAAAPSRTGRDVLCVS
jgi:hypothetical protein